MRSDCGGISSAIHYICYSNLDNVRFGAIQCVPCTLVHILNAAKKGDDKGRFKAIEAPDTLAGPLERAQIRVNGFLRQEGLYDVFRLRARLSALACSNLQDGQRGGSPSRNTLRL
jgi:hypothetical protein